MRCKTWQGLIAGYVADDLSRWRARRLEGHMAQCAECRSALAAMREIRAELRRAYSQPPADALREVREGVLAAVADEAPASRARRTWRPVLAGVAVIAVIAFGAAGYAWRGGGEPAQMQTEHMQTASFDVNNNALDVDELLLWMNHPAQEPAEKWRVAEAIQNMQGVREVYLYPGPGARQQEEPLSRLVANGYDGENLPEGWETCYVGHIDMGAQPYG